MGAQHSTSRLNRLSHGGQVPRAPKGPGSRATQLQSQNERAAQMLFARQNSDHLRVAIYRDDVGPIQGPLAPLPRKPSFNNRDPTAAADDALNRLDLESMALQGLPSNLALPVHALAEEEEAAPEGTQLSDMPVDILCRILAHVPRSSWPAARGVCHLWRDAVGTPEVLWQRKDVGKKDPWAILVEWVLGGTKDKKGILWAFDPSDDHTYRLGWVPEMEGISHSSQMVAIGPYAIFLGGTVSIEKENGAMDIVPGTAAWSYHLQTGRLRQMPDMLHGRVTFASAVINGKLIIAGGTGEGDTALDCVEEFDPKTGMWTELPSLKVARGKCYGGEHNGRFYVFSQNADEAPEKYCEYYDPIARTWTIDKKMSPANFSGKTANRFAVIGNKVVLTSDLGPDHGCGTLENHRNNLSMGNQLSWCTSVM